MLALRLEKYVIEAIDEIAKIERVNRSVLIREAILRFLEDREDLALAVRSKKESKSVKTLAQLRKELGLDS